MIYRKNPPQAPRLLLKVAAGATAVLAVACGSSSSSGGNEVHGVVFNGDGGDDATNPCGASVCGTVADPDSGIMGIADGSTVFPDAFEGSVVNPDAATEGGPVGLAPLDSGSGD